MAIRLPDMTEKDKETIINSLLYFQNKTGFDTAELVDYIATDSKTV